MSTGICLFIMSLKYYKTRAFTSRGIGGSLFEFKQQHKQHLGISYNLKDLYIKTFM